MRVKILIISGVLVSHAAMAAEPLAGAASTAPLAVPALFNPVPAAAPAPAPAQTPVVISIKATLKDGTHIEIMQDGSVLIDNADGTKTPAPDGVHTLRDGTTFEVKNGKQTGE